MNTFSREHLIKMFKGQSKGDYEDRKQAILTYGWIVSGNKGTEEFFPEFKYSKRAFVSLIFEVRRELNSLSGEDLAYSMAKASALVTLDKEKARVLELLVVKKGCQLCQDNPKEAEIIERWLKGFCEEAGLRYDNGIPMVTCHTCD